MSKKTFVEIIPPEIRPSDLDPMWANVMAADPEDQAPWLVIADCLDEHGFHGMAEVCRITPERIDKTDRWFKRTDFFMLFTSGGFCIMYDRWYNSNTYRDGIWPAVEILARNESSQVEHIRIGRRKFKDVRTMSAIELRPAMDHYGQG